MKPLTLSLGLIALVTLWRIVALAFGRVDLFMDEAQYWLWGQELALGTYSKPPLIGWVIRAATELGGSDAPFWVRLPSPLGHGLAGIAIALAARRLWPERPWAVLAGAVYVSLPGVALLALFVSTDDLLLPAFALALLAWLALIGGPSLGWALVLGLALGLGMLAKYAMAYFLGLVALAALSPALRIGRRDLGLALGLMALCLAPNIWWNLQNGLVTLTHTSENAGWAGIAWNWAGAGEFLATQLAAFGPVLGLAFPLALVLRPRAPLLALFSVGIFAAVALQALIRDANGNWAAPAFVAGSLLVTGWMAVRAPRLMGLGLGLNLLLSLGLALAPVWPDRLSIKGRGLFERAEGVAELSRIVLDEARAQGIGHVIADQRLILADLTYRAKGTGIAIWARPPEGAPDSHYALTRPAPAGAFPALYVSQGPLPPDCGRPVERHAPEAGALRRAPVLITRLEAPCGWPARAPD